MRQGLRALLFILAVGTFPATGEEILIDQIVATVNGTPIMLSEVSRLIPSKKKSLSPADFYGGSDASKALDALILRALITQEAASRRLTVTPADIDLYIEEIKKRNNFSDAALDAALKKEGKSREAYRQDIEMEILRSRLAAAVAKSDIVAATNEVDAYLRRNSPRAPKVHLIKVTLPKETIEEAIAKDIALKLGAGLSVEELELELGISDISTDVGFILEHELAPEISAATASLDTGVSDVRDGGDTWDIYIVKEREAADGYTEQDYAEAREAVKQEKTSSALTDYFLQELPKKYPVERKVS